MNERLLLSALEVRNDGKVGRVGASSTLADAQQRANRVAAQLRGRGVHQDVLHFCRPELLQNNYFHAVLEASKSVAEKLRQRTGATSDGAALVDATCSASSGPILRFNNFETETERSEQAGLGLLMKGLFSAYRNPTAHAPKVLWATDEDEAVDVLTLASMLHRRLDRANV
ncbi:TIGR02391 family protein [Actinomycetospora lutea]|uniref:TIGR02391 family protein n=1 Tax=Actinomycetospora lutea TaxID=663604 RepID=UPI00236673D6|nr:TIGR02391 family protein [Actinomycetospora lutea]MDD7936977.1 TIGR02391 family protein [Actinomycetospora lutea]